VYDEASHLIGEYKSNGTPIVEYVWKGDVPVAAIYGPTSATKIYYIVTDAQNTPRRLIDSSNNAVVWAWDSTAFGVAPPSVQTVKFNLRFPGQYYDEITKQHYNLNRYYNPEIGRYMEADPIGLEGGLNPYAYAGSNPVMNTDSTGLADWLDDIALRAVDVSVYDSVLSMSKFSAYGEYQASLNQIATTPHGRNIINAIQYDEKITSVSIGKLHKDELGKTTFNSYSKIVSGTEPEWWQLGKQPQRIDRYYVDIGINMQTSDPTLVAENGNLFRPDLTRVLAHELGHVMYFSLYSATKDNHQSIQHENIIMRQLNPNSIIRHRFKEHGNGML
jgi:RHS repeat-associated protein